MPTKKSRNNTSGLRPFGVLDEAEALAIRRKGQAAQQETLRRKRALKDVLDVVLATDATAEMVKNGRGTAEQVKRVAEAAGRALDLYDAIAIAQALKAASGDTAAATWVRDSAGDKPTDKAEVDAAVLTSADVELLRRLGDLGDKSAGTMDKSHT